MVTTRHILETSLVSDEELRQMIHDKVAAAICVEIPEMFGSIKNTLIETFDERYTVGTEVTAVAAARP